MIDALLHLILERLIAEEKKKILKFSLTNKKKGAPNNIQEARNTKF